MRKILFRIFQLVFLAVLLGTIAVICYWALSVKTAPQWTGFGSEIGEIPGQRAKTLWDWLGLLIVPLTLAFTVWLLNRAEKQHDREISRIDKEIALDNRHHDVLFDYIKGMKDLIINKQLLNSASTDNLRSIAIAYTHAALRSLDGERKGLLIKFLYESSLIKQPKPIIDLANADISNAQLEGAELNECYIYNANFHLANLRGANLQDCMFRLCDFSDADLSWSNLKGTDLSWVDLTNADLCFSELRDVNLEQAEIKNTKLDENDLSATNITREQLAKAIISKE